MKYLLTFVVEQSGMEDASPEEIRQAMEAWSRFDNEASSWRASSSRTPPRPGATPSRPPRVSTSWTFVTIGWWPSGSSSRTWRLSPVDESGVPCGARAPAP